MEPGGPGDRDRVEVIKLPAHSSNGGVGGLGVGVVAGGVSGPPTALSIPSYAAAPGVGGRGLGGGSGSGAPSPGPLNFSTSGGGGAGTSDQADDDAPLNLSMKPSAASTPEPAAKDLSMGGSRGLSTSTPTPGTSPASALASLGSLSAGIGAATTPGITDRISRRKPGSKPRRVIQSPSPVSTPTANSAPTPTATIGASVSPSPTGSPNAPLGSLATSIPAAPSASLAQLFAAADAPRPASRSGTLSVVTTPTPVDTETDSPPKDSSHRESGSRSSSAEGRPRNLGRGVSKPKKNTVASLLAQSRALGIKPTLDTTSGNVTVSVGSSIVAATAAATITSNVGSGSGSSSSTSGNGNTNGGGGGGGSGSGGGGGGGSSSSSCSSGGGTNGSSGTILTSAVPAPPPQHQLSLLKPSVLAKAASPPAERDRELPEANEATATASVTSSEDGDRASTPARGSTPTPTPVMIGSTSAPLTPTPTAAGEEKDSKKRPMDGTKPEDVSGQSSRQKTGDGISEDSSAGPDVSSDSCSASEAFPSDSEEDGEDGLESGKQDGEEGGPASKRRRVEHDEKELRVPLEQGWRRETVISGVSRTGVIRGEVTYFSPCGRRFKQYHEILRFLWKQNVTELTRDNFSFSSKVLLGDFLQPSSNPSEEPLRLSEEQVLRRLEEIRAALGSGSRRQSSAAKVEQARLAQEQRLAQQAEREKAAQAAKEAKRIAKEEAARQKEQVRLLKEQERCERQEAVRREREQRNLQMMEARRRRQEQLERQRQEDQLRKQQERELKRQQAVLIKEQAVQLYMQELNKQREMLYTVELERERRRQHMLLVKALEARKRLEERERRRQEARAEKEASRERRAQQRRLELELVREMRKPAEDMELTDHKSLPTLNRIPGLKLSGQAFADTLMVFEFLHNFGETLGFDMESLPSLNSLQMALLNDEEAEEELLSVMTHLLVCAIEDPGIPNPARHTTLLGQSLKQADITHANISEILRIYLYANATGEVKALTGLHFERDREKKSDHHNSYSSDTNSLLIKDGGCASGSGTGGICAGPSTSGTGKNAAFFEQLHDNSTWRMSEWLQEKPFLALNPTHKAQILAFLCNELLQNKAVLRQVDGSLETVAQLRKDRWLLDTKLRKLKMIQARKLRQAALQCTPNKSLNDSICGGLASAASTPVSHQGGAEESTSESGDKASEKAGDKVTPGKDAPTEPDADEDNEDEADEAESGNESEGTQPEEEEDKNLSVEELHRKLERLSRQSEAALQSLANSAQQLRATCFGQDRFWRRYWALPCAGGVFVEGMESAEPEEHRLAEQADLDDPPKLQEEKRDDKEKNEKEAEESTSDGENDHRKTPSRDSSLPPTLKEENGDAKLDDDDEDEDERGSMKQEKMDVEDKPKKLEQVDMNGDMEDSPKKDIKASESDTKSKVKSQLLENGDIERTSEIDEVNGVDSDDAKAKDDDKSDSDEPKTKKAKLEKLQDSSSDLSVVKVEIKSDLFEAELSGCKMEDKSSDDPVSLLANRPVQFERLGECMEKANNAAANGTSGDTSSPVIVPNGDKFNALNHLYSLGVINNGKDMNGSGTSGTGSCFLLGAGAGGGERNWFSILPRDACDGSSLSNGSITPSASPFSGAGTSGAELRIPVFPPPSRLSSPSPSQCESPAPLILTAEEMVQLEQLKRSGGLPEPGERQPVPLELRRGWWRITDRDQLQTILESLHSRGVRERELKRIVGRFLEHALESCGKAEKIFISNQTVLPGCGGEGRGEREHRGSLGGMSGSGAAGPGAVDLAITEADSKVSALPGGAPLQDQPTAWSPHVALRVDLQLLEQVESLEDKVANASMQVKGWKVPARATTEEGVRFRPACVPLEGPGDNRKDPVAVAKERLLALEAAIERRYLRPPLGISTGDVNLPGLNASTSGSGADGSSSGPSGSGSSASGSSSSGGASSSGGSGSGSSHMPCIGNLGPEADLPKGLVVWRDAVARARTSAQLAMALYSLEASVAWDKSIMKANCQFCHSGDNEDKLLLCDGCDKGYHTYCFRPKMEQIPDGDWYCFECMNKATGERNCIVCGKRAGRNLVVCEACPRAYHTDCLQPALAKVPRGKWFCSGCASRAPRRRGGGGGGSGSGRKPRGSSTQSSAHSNAEKASERTEKHRDSESSDHAAPASPQATSSGDDHTQGAPGTPGASPSPHTSGSTSVSGRKERGGKDNGPSASTPTGSSSSNAQSSGNSSGMSKKLARDLNPCKALLEDLEAHDEAWPFLLPVNTKQFPTYRKIIRSPMDLSTIKRKLQDAVYKSREEFCADVRLIFNNCETFNEDDSPVGKAGHSMRSFFETRWSEINGTHTKTSAASTSST